MSAKPPPIIDSFGRVHDSLRVSVTDRCNIRCFYCMPEQVRFLPQRDILSFEEIARFVGVCAELGVRKIRLTGGEPLMRAEIWKLVEMLTAVEGVEQIAMTTNAILLAEQAQKLKAAGLQRLNISLDSINPDVFERITRRRGLEKVLLGIAAAIDAGFRDIRLNSISVKGLTESEVVPLAEFARKNDLELRFIEFMPLDADGNWQPEQVLFGNQVRRILEENFGPLERVENVSNQAAVAFSYSDCSARVGFINSVSAPFCRACNRMRITARGQFMNCLFAQQVWDIRSVLRGTDDSAEIERIVRESIMAKKAGHGTDSFEFNRPDQAMYQIGG